MSEKPQLPWKWLANKALSILIVWGLMCVALGALIRLQGEFRIRLGGGVYGLLKVKGVTFFLINQKRTDISSLLGWAVFAMFVIAVFLGVRLVWQIIAGHNDSKDALYPNHPLTGVAIINKPRSFISWSAAGLWGMLLYVILVLLIVLIFVHFYGGVETNTMYWYVNAPSDSR